MTPITKNDLSQLNRTPDEAYADSLEKKIEKLEEQRAQLVAVAKAAKDCLENAKLMGITHSGLSAALSALDPDVMMEDGKQ